MLADLSFNAPSVARFLTVGGGALGADGSNSYADNVKLNEHRLPQIATIDAQSFRQLNNRPPDDRGNTYVAPNAYRRAEPARSARERRLRQRGRRSARPQRRQVQELGRSSSRISARAPLPSAALVPLSDAFPVQVGRLAALLRPAAVALPGPAVPQARARKGPGDGPALRHVRHAAGHPMSASRRGFLAASGVAALALAACGGDTDRETPERGPASGDLDIVNFALVLEYFEEDFYRQVLENDIVSGANRRLIRQIHRHERRHVAALEAAADKLGNAASPPQTNFEDVFGARRGPHAPHRAGLREHRRRRLPRPGQQGPLQRDPGRRPVHPHRRGAPRGRDRRRDRGHLPARRRLRHAAGAAAGAWRG